MASATCSDATHMAGERRPLVLVVFDYDWSLVNENSDTYVFKVLCPELLREVATRRVQQPSWTKLMDDLLGELVLREPQVSRADIQRAVAQIPIQERMLDAVRLAVDAYGAQVKIISDANTVYIQSMLEHHALTEHVTEVVTNPGAFEGDSHRLRVRPYHSLESEPHGCAFCPTNMCKGRILDDIRSRGQYDRVLYVGDGSGDFCPATKLSSRDIVFGRSDDDDGKSFGLLEKLAAHADMIQARVVPWRTGDDIYGHFSSALSEGQ